MIISILWHILYSNTVLSILTLLYYMQGRIQEFKKKRGGGNFRILDPIPKVTRCFNTSCWPFKTKVLIHTLGSKYNVSLN